MVKRTEPAIAKCLRASLPLFAGATLLWATNALAVAPVAVDDVFSTGNGVAVSGDLSANDSGLDGPTDAYVLDTAPLNGMVVVNTDGTFTYTPNAAYAGTDTFAYTISDGDGGASKAQVEVTVAAATNYISAASSLLITPEDTSVPLGLSVAQNLFKGGALKDIVATDVLFRPANGGLTPLTSTIPAGVSGIVITAFSSQSNDTAGPNDTDDDYQLLNARINLVSRKSSGRLANIVDGNLALLDQYSWSDVDLGQAVLSDPSKVVGFSTGASDPVFNVIGSQLQIIENHTLETAYHIEFTTATGDSTNFLGAASAVQLVGETQSVIDIATEMEFGSGKKGIMILSGNSAAGGNSEFEYKGFSRLVIDFDTHLVSGAIAVIRGESEANTVTYGFKGYPLVDLRNGSATINDVITGSASVIGDVTSISRALDSPKLYIDAAGDLVIERRRSFANNFTTMYTGEAYERTGFGSLASFVGVNSDDTLFNTDGGVASDGGPANELHFDVPASTRVGLAQMSWSTIGGNDTNENMGFGFAVIDMEKGTTSGSITFVRATTPDLVSWDSVPFNTTMFGATDAAGNPLYQSNKSAGTFTDLFGENAKFTLVNLADGSRRLVFTAKNGNRNQTFRHYQGNMQISWLGNEPLEIQGVPVTGSLTPGSPAADGNWEIDFSELPLLTYFPVEDSSDVVDLDFTLSSSGETESIQIYIEPVVDPVVITANDAVGFVDAAIPLSIDVGSLTDTDGSEHEPDPVTLQGVPSGVVLSSSAGTVTNISGGIWEVSVSALATLEAQSPVGVSATVFVFGEQVDEYDLDGSGVIDDNGNSVGADEYDVVNFTEFFQLELFDIPTVVPQATNLSSPVITGNAVLMAGESLLVTVNGVTYTNGDGNLVVNANGTWTLTLPAADALADGTYSVEAEKSLAGGQSAADITFGELLIDSTPPPAPGVTSQTTQDATPLISGTTQVGAGALSVEVNGVVYTEGDGNLVNNGDGTWDLTIPPADVLADNLYQVVAQITDAAGNSTIDSGVDELLVDTTAPPSPGVTSLTTNNDTPTISGTATVGAGETLTVEVNGISYTAGSGDLIDNGDGTWDLTIPPSDVLPEATYDVTATVTDIAGNSSADPSSQELTIDLTLPSTPVIFSQVTNNTTPVVSGLATILAGELLTVEVDGVLYTEGDAFLIDHGDGTWDLSIPPSNSVTDNIYNVTATVTDAAGNSSTDESVSELTVDSTATVAPQVVLTADVNDDVFLNITEASNPQPVDIFVPAGAVAGDSLLWTDGVSPSNTVLTATDIVAGVVSTWVALPADGAVLTVSSVLVDQVGNSSPSDNDEATVDVTPPVVPSVTNLITNITEPTVSGTATIGFGDVLTVDINGITYTAGDANLLDNSDGTWDLTIPAVDALTEATYDVTATVTDLARNASTDSSSAELIVDLTATGAPTVVLTADVNNDALLNSAEAQNPQPVEITLPAGAQVGDTLLWTDGTSPANTVLTAADIAAGIVSTSVALPADGSALTVSSLLRDRAGNISPSSNDSAVVDITTPSAPTIVIIEDANNNSFLIIAESMGPVDVNIQLPADAAVGDELTLTLDGVVSTVVLSAADIGAGVVNVTTPATGTGSTVQVEAFITDPAGNTTPTVNDSAVVDLSAPFIPTVNALTTNNATPTLTGTAAVGPGDVLTVTINSVTYTDDDGFLTHDGAGAWALAIPVADALADGTYEVAVTLMDPAGNTSFDTTVDELIVDTAVPVVPTVISQITNNQLPVISGAATVATGEALTVEVNGIGYVVGDGNLVNNGDGTWDLTIPPSDVLPEAVYNVIVAVTDTASNTAVDTTSAELTIDITPTAAPTVILTADVNNNTFLDTTEASNPQPVDILLPATAEVGDTLLWTDMVSPANTVLTAADIAAGVVSTTVALPAEGTVLTVTSVLADEAGNNSPSGVDSATVDTTPSDPPVPVIVADADNNALLNIAEALDPQPIDVILPVTAAAGFTLTVNDGTSVTSIVLTAADIAAGVVSITAALPADGSPLSVLANLEDIAGNVSINASDLAEVDLTMPDQPSVIITEDVSNDGFINIAENVGLVDVSVTLPASAAVGDTLTTEIQGVVTTQVLTAADITAGTLNFTSLAPAQGALVVAEAFLTDPSGNDSSTASDTAQLDISPPAVPTVDSQTINNGIPVITGTATVDLNDSLRVTVNGVSYVAGDGNLIDNGNGLWSLTIPAADALASTSYDVAVEVVDLAGNATSDATTDELIVDLVAPAIPTVNSLLTNLSTPTLNGTAVVSSAESLSVMLNGVVYNEGDGNLSLTANGDWTLNIPANDALTDGNYEVLVKVTDTAGNLTPDSTSDELVVDLTSTAAPTVILVDDANDDAFLNVAEASNPQSVSIILPAGAVVGDTLLWTDGSSPMNTILTAADIAAGVVSTTVALPADSSVLTVSSVLTDQAGNVSPGKNDSATVDTTTPAVPSIVITEDTNNDAFLSLAESNGPVGVSVSLSAGVVAGDTLTVVLDGVTSTIVLSTNDVSVGAVNVTTPAPADNSSIVVEAFITDIAGNVTAIVDDTVLVDTSAPFIPTAHSQITNITAPTLTGNAAVGSGDVLIVTVNGISYIEGDGNLSYNGSGSASGNGAWSLVIPTTDALVDGTYDISVSLTDPAGNTSVDITSDELVIDTVVPQAPGVTSQTTPDTTPTISGITPLAPGVTLTVEVNGVTYTQGDGNLLVNPDGTWDLTIPAADLLADGLYQVLATTTDLAGNTSIDLGIDELVVDTVLPTTPGVTSLVANTTVPVIEGVATVGAGETLTVTVNGITYTAGDGNLLDNGDGTWLLSIPVANALPEAVYSVTASVTDQAGNTGSDPSSDELTIDLTAPGLPAVNTQLSNLSTPTVQGTALLLPGETLMVTINGVTYVAGDGNLVDNGDETWILSIPSISALAEATYDVSVHVIDQAGNITQDASMNELEIDLSSTVAPIPVLIADVNNDAYLNISEAQALQPVSILLPAGAVVGDTLLWSDGLSPSNTLLNAGDIAAGSYQTSVALPVDGSMLTVTAVIVDLAGNASPTGTDSATVDISVPTAPTIVIAEDANDDSFLNVSELMGAVDVVINLPAGAIAGDTLVITLDGVTTSRVLNSVDIILGAISVTTTVSIQGASILVEANLVDSAGNASIISDDVAVIDSTMPFVPLVDSLITNNITPTITGNAVVGSFDVLQVTVNGITYTDGDGALVNNGNGTWSLTVPATDALVDGNYDVAVSLTDLAGNNSVDLSLDELVIDTLLPASPGVTSLVTNSGLPTIQGTVTLLPSEIFTVSVNGVSYTLGDGNLVLNGDETWTLTIPLSDELPENAYDVVATVTDSAGNVSTDPSSTELVIDLTAPIAPTVMSQASNNPTPVINGTVDLEPGEVFTVTVNGVTYTAGDANLVVNPDGSWELGIPASDALSEGVHEVLATVTDVAGNVTSDVTADELTIDLTAPAVPTFVDVLSSSSTPTVGGQVQLEAGDSFTVTVNGVIYTVGDGFLTFDADGNWELMIDPSQPLADGVYDVTLSFEDAAGNLVSNAPGQQIIIDTGAPSLTINDLGVVATYRPTLGGTTNAEDGSIVTIRDANGEIVCEAVVSNGVWECIPTIDLVEGVNDFTAEVADTAGNLIVLNLSVTVSADFDGDGIANNVEGFGDTDGDGVPDANDLDSDNDGIPDANEGAIDSDADGLPNYLDGDADNDGLADILEAEGLDGNSDFSVDNFIDEDNNGLSDELQIVPLNVMDTDFDGVPDYLDVDSDNDAVPDLRESLGEDVDNNGRIDEFVDLDSNGVDDGVQAFPLTIQDTDNDGVPNHLDLNSDNDALSDLVEAIGLDINGDSIVDAMTDADQDGIPDSVDFSVIGGSDADGDDIEDSADVDFVLGDDTDGDGIVDEFDPDANGDGYFDGFTDIANLPETDVNDIPELQEAEAEEFGELRTGRRGFGGCSIDTGSVSSRDPLLLLLTLFAFTGFIRSRRVANGVSRRRSLGFLWVACLVVCSTSLLHSDDVRADHTGDFHKRIYLGAGVGASYLDPDDSEIPFKLEEQNDAAWGGYIGVDLGSRVSLELGYNDLGQAELEQDHFVDYQQTSLSALIYGFNRKAARERRTGLSAFGRLGVTRMQNESDIDFVRDNDFSVVIGVGAELAHASGLALRAEATSYDVDANYFGLSLVYRFGHGTHKENLVKTSSRPLPEAAPEPAPAPAPEIIQPLVDVAPPAPTITESVPSPRLEYKVLFDTNSSELNAEAIRMVEEIERQARAQTTVNIEITGYADKRGSAEYNLWLSKQRALSVANRLIQRGIVEFRIQLEVGGEVDQFGSMSTRAGRQENRRVQVILLGN